VELLTGARNGIISFVMRDVELIICIKHIQAIINLEPRSEPLETPVDIVKETKQYGYGDRTYTDITITER